MDFPSNSKEPKPERPKKEIQRVTTNDVIQKPKSVGRKFRGIFFGGEFKSAARYILNDVMLPALKNVIVDSTAKGVERIVYGDVSPRRRYDGRGPLISYNQMGRDRSPRPTMLPDQPPYYPTRGRKLEPGDLVLISREEAELVLERLNDIIDTYDVASIADLNDLCGLPTTHIDNKWGWSKLSGVAVRQVREGFLIDLPPVEPL